MDDETRHLLRDLMVCRRDQVATVGEYAKRREWDMYYKLHYMEKVSRQIESIICRVKLVLKDSPTDSLTEHLTAARKEIDLFTDSMRSRVDSDPKDTT